MELKDFITQTLSHTIEGISEAQEETKAKKSLIGPELGWNGTQSDQYFYTDKRSGKRYLAQMIDFDVAIEITGSGEAKGGIGVFSGIIGEGVQG